MHSRLKILRKQLELSQEAFGEKLGVTKASISRLESGINNLTDQMINLICRTFNVNEAWLRTGEGNMFIETDDTIIDAVVNEYDLSDFGREFLRVFVGLTPDQQEALKQIAYTMLSAIQKNENLRQDYEVFQMKTVASEEPAHGTEEWIKWHLAEYEKELRAEKSTPMSVVSQDTKKAMKNNSDMEASKELA